MKKILIIIPLLASLLAGAQQYNNEWIDFSKTYYKFKIGAEGLYRIPQSVIATAGLANTPVTAFQLFHNGVEVPVYTSVSTGLLAPNDYIEFWGHINDGKPDKALYRNPAYQHTDKFSLETDTSAYFLTVNTTGTPFHFTNQVNDTSSNVLPAETFFMHTAASYFRVQINPGFATVLEQYIYSSSYDKGEFFSSDFSTPSTPLSDNQTNLYLYAGGPSASLRFGAAGCSDTLRHIQVKVNNNLVKDTVLNTFNDIVSTVPVALGNLNSASTNFQFINASLAVTYQDRLVVSFYELTYPRQYNFGGLSNFYFELPPKAGGYFLKISNFNTGAANPVLYDQVSGNRYSALSGGGTLSFALPGNINTSKLTLVNEDPSNIKTVNALQTKHFVSYSDPLNQGNYLIISNPMLYTGSSGNNPVLDYKTYRSSPGGGGYNVQLIDINELIDQFAFGVKQHPSAIKNFLNFARNTFTVKPQFTFLIGRGMAYNDYRNNESYPNVDVLNMIPSFGFPASDVMLSTADGATNVPLTPIGRLGAINGIEVENYLTKLKDYEQVQQTAPHTLDARGWRKTVVHITGATDPFLESILCNFMHNYQSIIADTLFGATVYNFCSTTVDQNNQISNALFPKLFSSGIGILTYFGHSSASNLGFNLDDPTIYNNAGKYPVFYVNGCYAGNYYTFDPGRLTLSKTISENYVLTPNKGSIAFIASTHFGVVNYLNVLLDGLYRHISTDDYGKSIGNIEIDAAKNVLNVFPTDFFARCQNEQMNIHGDPALVISEEKLADYDVEASMVQVSPTFASVADNSFIVNATFVNLGKAVSDSITVLITRKYPDGTSAVVLRKRIPGILYSDSVQVSVPIVATRDKGQNYITVTINADNDVPEITTTNNTVTAGVYIYEDELSPIYPYNYAIVTNPSQKLYASTANPFAPSIQYVMEMDTTTLYNSGAKITKNITSTGGVLEFDPGIKYSDSTVYYWRTSIVPTQNGQYHWNQFSFIYIDSLLSSPGFNQSHYFQQLASTGNGMSLPGSRLWTYGTHLNNLYINHSIYPTSGLNDADFSINVNSKSGIASACLGYSLIFTVFDPVTFQPWKNVNAAGQNLYLSGSASANCTPSRNTNFEFSYLDATNRNKMVRFMDSIPNGFYVVVRDIAGSNQGDNTYANDWKADTSIYGSNNSIYHRLVAAGFTTLDSFYRPRAFAFVYKKADAGFTPQSKMSIGIYDKIVLSVDCPSPNLSGSFTSPVFGPAKKWKQLHWRGSSVESPSTDSVGVQVIGVDTSGNQTPLYNLNAATQDFDISAVNVQQYPYLKLKMTATDSIHGTPFQLRYWRLNYLPVPEGALAPNIYLSSQDTLELGQKLDFGIAFKNVSISAFDSMRINLLITDKNNVTHVVPIPRRRPLISGDTLKIFYEIDTKDYPGLNTIYLDVNPANDQPEQYHFNNFLYKSFYVKVDKTNPLLDVTFDNVHILNEDIVSAKPHIIIKLKDEAKFLLLNDTSVLKVQLRYPDGSLHPYYFNSDTLKFTPATSSADNTASVDFTPVFNKQTDPNGDDYTLIVTGSDKSGNSSGVIQYQVTFKVITKAMISNMLNYPNPFTTSTAFVFTITGSDVPQNIKIQILTISGKIVREITKEELGPLHVGRNITEFKWDGTDMYHQRLAIGVYLYHVVTNLNGKSLDKYKSGSDNTDQYFTKGYGKMFLMR